MRGKSSPWGSIQSASELIPGAWLVHTAGHGGVKLDRKLNARVPESVRRPGGWYEEDCEWSLAVVALADMFPASWVDSAHRTAKNWYPDEYARLTGASVSADESIVLATRDFETVAAGRLKAIAAWGDWHEAVPKGMVGVVATESGLGDDTKRYFLTTKARYDARGRHLYLVQDDDQPWQGPGN